LYCCISSSNSGSGFSHRGLGGTTGIGLSLINCDAADNTQDGLRIEATTTPGMICVENTNFINNGGWGINQVDSLFGVVHLANCGFGSGSQANVSGEVNLPTSLLMESGRVTYTPDTHPYASSGFNLANRRLEGEALGAGRGDFYDAMGTPTSYPDIGAAAGLSTRFVIVGRQSIDTRR
jgi:hypothetical protein